MERRSAYAIGKGEGIAAFTVLLEFVVILQVVGGASPLAQESSARVMTDHFIVLTMLVSALCFARFARTGQIGDGLIFGTVAAVAILTHGRAWALCLVPGITLALTNRWCLLRRLGLWLPAVLEFWLLVFPGTFLRSPPLAGGLKNMSLFRAQPAMPRTSIRVWGSLLPSLP